MHCMARIYIMELTRAQYKLTKIKNLNMEKIRKFANFYCRSRLIKNKYSKNKNRKSQMLRKRCKKIVHQTQLKLLTIRF